MMPGITVVDCSLSGVVGLVQDRLGGHGFTVPWMWGYVIDATVDPRDRVAATAVVGTHPGNACTPLGPCHAMTERGCHSARPDGEAQQQREQHQGADGDLHDEETFVHHNQLIRSF